jgi:hypothetical protein
MALTAGLMSPLNHPWLTEFSGAPVAALGDLLAGYASVFPYDRADAPDAARMLFGPFPADDPLRVELDRAVIGWLEQRRKASLSTERPRLQRAIREISEAFEIIALLELPNAAVDLRRRFVVWNEWVARLILSPARDARAQYWRTLALTQRLVAESRSGLNAKGLEPLWHRICREAGGPLPKRYLDIGLLGLRSLPADQHGFEVPWLAGLAHWALAHNPSTAEFNAEWFALKALYPRAPQRWRELISGLLSTTTFSTVKAPAWWSSDNDFRRESGPRRPTPSQSPLPADAQALIARFHEPFARVEPRIDALFSRHHDFVTHTGDARYFARACHVVGRALIERDGDDPHGRARKAQLLAREGLGWEPYDRFLWSLWRDALVADGKIEAAELVGWEKMKRVPADPETYSEVGGLLSQQPSRRDEAEALYRYAIKRFPNNPFFRHRLAELFLIQDRLPEATSVIDEVFSAGLPHAVTYVILARLRSFAGNQELAREAIEGGLTLDPSNEVLLGLRDRLERGEALPLKSSELQQPLSAASSRRDEGEDPALAAAMRSGLVRRLRFRLEAMTDAASTTNALSELRELLREEPTFAYAELLAARQGVWQAERTTLPSFAAAFEDALREEDRAKLEQLAQQQPRLNALILVARAVLGDASAAREIEEWLRAEPTTEETAVAAVLRVGLRPMLQVVDGGVSAPETFISHREAIVTVLHDANEASVDEDLPLAA